MWWNCLLDKSPFLLLILSGASARLLLLTVPLVKFIQIFDKKIVEGSRLLKSLKYLVCIVS